MTDTLLWYTFCSVTVHWLLWLWDNNRDQRCVFTKSNCC